MTIRDLIARLQEHDPDSPVYIDVGGTAGSLDDRTKPVVFVTQGEAGEVYLCDDVYS